MAYRRFINLIKLKGEDIMFNKAILMGRLTRDPEQSTSPSGVIITRFTLAVDRRYQKQGEEKQTDFINIVSFRNTAEFVKKYFTKGQMMLVSGSIQSRSYEKDGEKRWVTEIVAEEVNFCGSKNNSTNDVLNDLREMSGGFMPVDNSDECPF